MLDVRPYGLGHTVQYTTHCFEELGVALPRLELARRGEYMTSLWTYLDSDGERCSSLQPEPGALPGDHCRLLREGAVEFDAAFFPCAVADCAGCLLQPSEEALVPAVWDRPLADGTHYCVGTTGTQMESGLEAQPGVWDSSSREMMLAVRNASLDPVTIERGCPLAFSVGLVGDAELQEYVGSLREEASASDRLSSLAEEGPSEELAPCDIQEGDQLSLSQRTG